MDELDNIQDHIYLIRGYRVMLDFDLAKLYEVKTSGFLLQNQFRPHPITRRMIVHFQMIITCGHKL